jgi:hypothetical protein
MRSSSLRVDLLLDVVVEVAQLEGDDVPVGVLAHEREVDDANDVRLDEVGQSRRDLPRNLFPGNATIMYSTGPISAIAPPSYPSAFALICSYSACEIAPESSSCFAFSISAAAPPPETDCT